jgi:hypothetical protein
MHVFPHAVPVVEILQHEAAGMHAFAAFGASLGGSAA